MRSIFAFLRDDSGAAAAEYALLLAIIGSGLAAGAILLGQDISHALSKAGSSISSMNFTVS
jgi:pilus assembly protein Flp/PilA